MPQVPNGYPPGLGMYESQAKFSMYSQFPNGSANGYGAIRSYGEHGLLPGEGTVLRGPGLQERPLSPVSPPLPTHHPHLHHHQHHMKVHTRINTRGHREYHVQFFGSVAERAWIHEKRITTYQGKQQFDELQAETLRKTTNPVEKQKLLKPIPQRERAQWEERKPQRRSGRSRSESERGNDPIPKKKTKKEQAEMAPETTLKTGSQKGASEISDAFAGCGCYYHEECVQKLPGATSSSGGGFSCPQHSCSTCCLERDVQRASKGRLIRCIRCPLAYHPGDGCLAAGSVILTHHIMICSNHGSAKKNGLLSSPVNVGWWWPAEICNPRLVPSNIQSLRHDVGDFPVFFFGSHDYYWINQGRVFPYVENDKNFVTGQININKTFKKALEEAARRFQELKAQRESREALEQERNSRKPPPYKLIKANKPVGKVQMHVADLSEIQRCNCKPTDEHPCSHDSQCLNRMLRYECHPQVCPAGDRCENQCFSKRLYAETEVVKTDGCGWGLRTNQDLHKGDFVTEYVGEVIDTEECQQRIKHAHEKHVTNFYMLTLTKDRVIDAGPKGNSARFMNHSCSPNCETQKWTVNGDVRIGLFALCDIEAGAELTFNYNLHCVGNRRMSCHCGSDNCSGFLGVQPTTAVVTEKEEKAKNAKLKPKKRKLRPESKHTHEYFCFCCGGGGELVMCDRKECPKAYHLLCLNLTKPPYGRWECPWHDCSICGAPASSLCDFCPRSFCQDHEMGALTASSLGDRPCCSSHNPLSPLGSSSAQPRRYSLSSVGVKPEPEAGQMTKE
uniref:Wolf-Hirschhorn syndrome candidate 1-like 1 n=1 Tax=Nothobranchius rachovii TaxID=451742 RepID=A0A1A8P0M0_9TELE